MAEKHIRILFLTLLTAFVFSMSVWATDYTVKGTYTWKVHEDGLYYAYDATTGELITRCKVGKCYVNKNGTRYLNRFVKGIYYNAKGYARKNFQGGWIKTGGKVYYFYNKKKVKGYKKISGKYYFFDEDGVRMSGVQKANGKYRFFRTNGKQVTKKCWKTVDGKKYRLGKKGIITEGFFTVSKKKYYQTAEDGILKGEQEIDGVTYTFSSSGVLQSGSSDSSKESEAESDSESSSLGAESDILFFTTFESGSEGYAQTGGDSGKACGKYQFDYRYSLIPLLKFCYSENPEFFKGFKSFLSYSAGDSRLINNSKLYKAWKNCYKADAAYFASMQDQFAINNYYKPVEKYLSDRGIHLAKRPYVIRGAVFSYAIQHGQITAAKAVIGAGLKDSVTDKKFLEKLYTYRWKSSSAWNQNSLFKYRYTTEKSKALSILNSIK